MAQESGVVTEIISRTRFRTPRVHGPVVIDDRVVEAGREDPVVWVERATASAVQAERRGDGPIRSALPDEVFWQVIGLLGGRLDEDAVGQLVAALGEWEYAAQVSYQEAFDRKLFELDRPGNTVGYCDDPGVVDGEASLMYRCEIIAAGRDVFTQRARDPRPGVPCVDGISAPEILYVLEEVSPYGMPRKTVPIETGSNPAHWPDAPPVRAPWTPLAPELPSPSPFSQRVQLETLGLDDASSGVLYGFVAYGTTDALVREIVGCTMASTASAAAAELEPFLRARLAHERLHERMILTALGTGPIRGGPLVEVHRRGLRSVTDYVNQFVGMRR
jgi:hypothetical protein